MPLLALTLQHFNATLLFINDTADAGEMMAVNEPAGGFESKQIP